MINLNAFRKCIPAVVSLVNKNLKLNQKNIVQTLNRNNLHFTPFRQITTSRINFDNKTTKDEDKQLNLKEASPKGSEEVKLKGILEGIEKDLDTQLDPVDFKRYVDDDYKIIMDVDDIVQEQTLKYSVRDPDTYSIYDDDVTIDLENVNLKRGKTGVFDLEELIEYLKKQNCQDIVVIGISSKLAYADYLVIATAKSNRHLNMSREIINKIYKKKKNDHDSFVKVEGRKESDTWQVLDMGKIVFHLMLEETREFYDLESLWTLSTEYDPELHKAESHETYGVSEEFLKEFKPKFNQ